MKNSVYLDAQKAQKMKLLYLVLTRIAWGCLVSLFFLNLFLCSLNYVIEEETHELAGRLAKRRKLLKYLDIKDKEHIRIPLDELFSDPAISYFDSFNSYDELDYR